MTAPAYIEDIAPSTGFLLPARTWRPAEECAYHLSLNGQWRFRLHPTCTIDPDTAWEEITLPCHWVFSGSRDSNGTKRWDRGTPLYTNIQFPFPRNVPHVPQGNPTGEHERDFFLSPEAIDALSNGGRAILRFLGVESIAKVSVNDSDVAVLRGSRLMHEIDVTDHVRKGNNYLSVTVSQWSAMSYIEDQDQWWLPGIFRDIDFYIEAPDSLTDVRIHGDYDPQTQACTLHLWVDTQARAVECTIEGRTHNLASEQWQAINVPEVLPWSPDAPHLYDCVIRTATDERRMRVGFRRIDVQRGEHPRILVNGRKLELRGVNRHETHPDKGRTFDAEQLRRDLVLMKRHNINAIRTAHYPHDPRFYDLADEYGFWVICEVDCETHGFAHGEWDGNPSDSPQWREVYVDRGRRTVSRDYNHPSIIMWSLGNESGYGDNLADMAAEIRRLDPSRPIHYEGDYDGRITDVHSRMYLPLEQIRALCSPEGDIPNSDVATWGHLRRFPLINCEYAHAMGNGPGALVDYDACIDAYESYHGGFVWEWRDHGLRTWDKHNEYFGYGGDFGETVHDSNFVMDGLVRSDGVPSPALAELKAVNTPLKITARWEGQTLLIHLHNRYHAQRSTILTTSVYSDGEYVGIIDHDLGPGEKRTFNWRHPSLTTKAVIDIVTTRNAVSIPGNAWEDEGWEVARTQVRPLVRPLSIPRSYRFMLAGEDLVSLENHRIVGILGLPVSGLRPSLWRAPTDNDRSDAFGSFSLASPDATNGFGIEGSVSSEQMWRRAGLDRMVCQSSQDVLVGDGRHGSLERREVWAPAQSRARLNMTWRWQWGVVEGEAVVVLSAILTPSRYWSGTWPRTGIHMEIPRPESVCWYGMGPGEAYADSRQAVTLGRYQLAPEELRFDYAVPQENGTRIGLRELSLIYPELRIDMRAHPHVSLPDYSDYHPSFSLHEYDEYEMTKAGHPYQLVTANDHWHLYLDGGQHGLGSRTCGADVYPRYAWTPRAITLEMEWRKHP